MTPPRTARCGFTPTSLLGQILLAVVILAIMISLSGLLLGGHGKDALQKIGLADFQPGHRAGMSDVSCSLDTSETPHKCSCDVTFYNVNMSKVTAGNLVQFHLYFRQADGDAFADCENEKLRVSDNTAGETITIQNEEAAGAAGGQGTGTEVECNGDWDADRFTVTDYQMLLKANVYMGEATVDTVTDTCN